jgi:hypothetical protein
MATLTLTKVLDGPREWSPKDNPDRKFHSWTVEADDGNKFEINTKAGNEVKLGTDEFTVTPPKPGTDFPPKLKRVQQNRNGGGGMSPERQAAVQRQHSQEMAIRMLDAFEPRLDGRTAKTYLPQIKALTDWFDADVNQASPNASQDGGVNPPSLPAPSSSAGPSDKQLDFLERLLQEAGVDVQDRLDIKAWAKEKLTGGKEGTMSAAIDAVKSGTADRLITAAKAWVATQSDIPADTRDLQPAPDTFIADDESIPF